MTTVQRLHPNIVLGHDVIQGLLDRADEIEGSAVVIHWKDGTITNGWSQMTTDTLIMMTQFLAKVALDDAIEKPVKERS